MAITARNAIYEMLVLLERAGEEETASQALAWLAAMVPDYWEAPRLPADSVISEPRDKATPRGCRSPTRTASGPQDYRQRVDDYAMRHGVSRAEVFRRIAALTGNSVHGLSLRYYMAS